MPKYYLHPVFDVAPILPFSPLVIDTDLTLDLRPGAMIHHKENFYVVLDEKPIQDTMHDAVHFMACLQEDYSGMDKAADIRENLRQGWWPHQRR